MIGAEVLALHIYVDADACPVKQELYRVARRYEQSLADPIQCPPGQIVRDSAVIRDNSRNPVAVDREHRCTCQRSPTAGEHHQRDQVFTTHLKPGALGNTVPSLRRLGPGLAAHPAA